VAYWLALSITEIRIIFIRHCTAQQFVLAPNRAWCNPEYDALIEKRAEKETSNERRIFYHERITHYIEKHL